MPKRTRAIDTEYRHALTKAQCYEIMDYLQVQFSDKTDIHYNYYFDTPNGQLAERNITLRERTIRKEGHISYHLTLKIPTIDEGTFLEYHQRLSEKEMRLLVYNDKLPDGEIKELDSIHGGDIRNVNMIRVNRVNATYKNVEIFFDKISHRGETFYEVGSKINHSGETSKEEKLSEFKELLKIFKIDFKQAKRRSLKYQ